VQRHDGFDFRVAPQYAALELEVGEAVARLRRFCQAHDGLRVEGRLVAQRQPWVTRSLRRGPVCEIAPSPVADVEQVAEDRHALALPALAEQRRDRHAEVLAEWCAGRRWSARREAAAPRRPPAQSRRRLAPRRR